MIVIRLLLTAIRTILSASLMFIGVTLTNAVRMLLGFFSIISGLVVHLWYMFMVLSLIIGALAGELDKTIFNPTLENLIGIVGVTLILSFFSTICAFAEAICDWLEDGVVALAALILGGGSGLGKSDSYEVGAYQPYDNYNYNNGSYKTLGSSQPQQSMTIHVVHHNGEDMSILKEKDFSEKDIIEGDFLEKAIK